MTRKVEINVNIEDLKLDLHDAVDLIQENDALVYLHTDNNQVRVMLNGKKGDIVRLLVAMLEDWSDEERDAVKVLLSEVL